MKNKTRRSTAIDEAGRLEHGTQILNLARGKDDAERIVRAIRMMVKKAEVSILKPTEKETSVGDYQRLLQLRREHATETVREIEVRWIDPATAELSGME